MGDGRHSDVLWNVFRDREDMGRNMGEEARHSGPRAARDSARPDSISEGSESEDGYKSNKKKYSRTSQASSSDRSICENFRAGSN